MDTIVRGSIAGLIATVLYGIVNWVLYITDILPSTAVHYAAVLITPPGTSLTTMPMISGIIAFMIAGTFVGVILSYVIRWTGDDYAWLKGLGIGAVLWPIHTAILPGLIAPHLYQTLPPTMVLASFVLSSLWGVTVGFILQYLARKEDIWV
ncbi:hypothetical protein SPSYN_01034 [Sporotomaculum syntrophicum]|uniref:Uncharacterized protein n=1 Tax=Sporotomaculum syntrophicum TaxID=182264 RepID=A0A9D3AYL7_9FIRM|nr:hypothetical protein [Sporotomaculum syntrophicum]KAF1084898.1 hypothetical protein SPSYN_01034 [Sporotomaculum syntrophicum]